MTRWTTVTPLYCWCHGWGFRYWSTLQRHEKAADARRTEEEG